MNIFNYSTEVLIATSSLVMTPIIVNAIIPSFQSITQECRWLSMSLGLKISEFVKYVIWPEIKKPLGFALATAITLNVGSLSAINFLGSENLTTLPLLLYQKINNFQLDEASAVAFYLLLISYMLFEIIERWSGGK